MQRFKKTHLIFLLAAIPLNILWILVGTSYATVVERKSGIAALPRDGADQDTVSQQDTSLHVMTFLEDRRKTFRDKASKTVMTGTDQLSLFPATSIQQYLKGQASGLYIQESTGEPGAVQNMFVRGSSVPLLSIRDVYQTQPLIVLDGVPLIGEHPFAYDIQQFDFERIGPATNLSTIFDMANIENVHVLKDIAATSMYGPQAANGVILIRSKQASTQRRISANVYTGAAVRPSVATLNGAFEHTFRRQFYDRYTANGRYSEDDLYPLYLSDSTNTAYYGPSDWTDTYYGTGLVYSANASISGGSERANFRFSLGTVRNDGVADETGLERYNTTFNVSMKPLKWLQFTAVANASRLERNRNKQLRDRFATMSYLPDLEAPLSPNNQIYGAYMNQFDQSFDDNFSNVLNGFASLAFDFGRLKAISRVAVDYNEGYRDLFFPRTVFEFNSFASNYYGFNQRLIFDNLLLYDVKLPEQHNLLLEAGQSVQWDFFKYNYAYAYRGVNDFIKLNLLESDPKKTDLYLHPTAFPRELVFRFLDRTRHNQLSFFGKGSYNYQQKYTATVLLRADASSNAQPTSRWLFAPTVSLGWNIKQDVLLDNSLISELNLRASAGRQGRLNTLDNYSQGPQYTADITFSGHPTASGYNSFATLNRPYNFGWVGYGVPWAYSDQVNIGVDFSFFANRLQGSLDWYTRTDKNQLLGIPAFAEYGYSQSYEHGMAVNNTGLELMVNAQILRPAPQKVGWSAGLNLNFNSNKLRELPRGLDQIVIGDRKLEVGKPVDQYWLLRNDGLYASDADVPMANGTPMTYNSIPLRAGDPIWRDVNNDQQIDDNDKQLVGNMLPRIAGGLTNQLSYGNWSLMAHLYVNLGRNILNQEMANRFDFINREGNNDMQSVKEITFWEKRGDYDAYPLYNPWSPVIPYRVDQDLFLENASFLKLRTLAVSRDLSDIIKQGSRIERIHVYVSAHNLFTLTPYSGRDPELVDFRGINTGYGLPIPRTYTLGIKVDL